VTGAEVRMDRGDPFREVMSPGLLTEPLTLRPWRPGDRFRPLGLPGAKKLQDFFVDAKVPRDERRRIPLLVAGGRIAWVVGHRIADEFRWHGEPVACLAEVKFPEAAHGLPAGSHPAVGR
jgi:tRNA(Ile)-lysidine synthetase-like protein